MKANPALKFIRKNLSKTPSGTPGGLSFPTQQEIVKWKQELPYEDNLRMLFFFHVENLVGFRPQNQRWWIEYIITAFTVEKKNS